MLNGQKMRLRPNPIYQDMEDSVLQREGRLRQTNAGHTLSAFSDVVFLRKLHFSFYNLLINLLKLTYQEYLMNCQIFHVRSLSRQIHNLVTLYNRKQYNVFWKFRITGIIKQKQADWFSRSLSYCRTK